MIVRLVGDEMITWTFRGEKVGTMKGRREKGELTYLVMIMARDKHTIAQISCVGRVAGTAAAVFICHLKLKVTCSSTCCICVCVCVCVCVVCVFCVCINVCVCSKY